MIQLGLERDSGASAGAHPSGGWVQLAQVELVGVTEIQSDERPARATATWWRELASTCNHPPLAALYLAQTEYLERQADARSARDTAAKCREFASLCKSPTGVAEHFAYAECWDRRAERLERQVASKSWPNPWPPDVEAAAKHRRGLKKADVVRIRVEGGPPKGWNTPKDVVEIHAYPTNHREWRCCAGESDQLGEGID